MTAGTPESSQDPAQKLDRLSNGLERLSQYVRQREEHQHRQDQTWDVVKSVDASAIALIGLWVGKAG